jgi:hypothetical protein
MKRVGAFTDDLSPEQRRRFAEKQLAALAKTKDGSASNPKLKKFLEEMRDGKLGKSLRTAGHSDQYSG